MNYVYPLLVAAGGALGALCRYMTTLALAGWAGTAFPYGTLAVNGAGSFLIGLLGVCSPAPPSTARRPRTAGSHS